MSLWYTKKEYQVLHSLQTILEILQIKYIFMCLKDKYHMQRFCNSIQVFIILSSLHILPTILIGYTTLDS